MTSLPGQLCHLTPAPTSQWLRRCDRCTQISAAVLSPVGGDLMRCEVPAAGPAKKRGPSECSHNELGHTKGAGMLPDTLTWFYCLYTIYFFEEYVILWPLWTADLRMGSEDSQYTNFDCYIFYSMYSQKQNMKLFFSLFMSGWDDVWFSLATGSHCQTAAEFFCLLQSS